MNEPRRDPLQDQLEERLRVTADSINVPPGDLKGVVARGRRRQRLVRAAGAVATMAIAAIVVVVLGDAARTPQPDVVDEPSTSAATPSPSSTTSDVAVPAPAPSATASPTPPDDSSSGGTTAVLVATENGIVRWRDGEVAPVPGIDTPVDLAFPDGQGGVVFQRNPVGIGRLVDGRISTIVALSQFPARTFPDYPDVEVTASNLRLRDVDPASGRILFTVRYGPQALPDRPEHVPIVYDVVTETTVSGDGVTELATAFTWEEGFETISVGGGRTATNFQDILTAGAVRMLDAADDEPLLIYAGDAWEFGDRADADYAYVRGGQLARDGSTIAGVDDTDGAVLVRVLRVEDGTTARAVRLADLADSDALGPFPTVLDHVTGAVLLGSGGESSATLLVDLTSGESTLLDVTGHGAFAD